MNLLSKPYTGILALCAESDMQSVVSTYWEVIDDEPGKSEYSAILEQTRNSGELVTKSDDDLRNTNQTHGDN